MWLISMKRDPYIFCPLISLKNVGAQKGIAEGY